MYSLDILNKLEDIKSDKDIKGLSYAIFPGTHCPLFGVMLTASYIKNMAVVVVGTNECTYYTKNFVYNRQKGQDKVYSIALKEKEVVFGARNLVKESVEKIIEIENPDALMIVTTCVPEIIGEDYSSIESEKNVPIFVVNTEHFKCNSHIPGMKRALSCLSSVMKNQEKNNGINILGHRHDNALDTELIKLLTQKGVEINAIIPSKCNIEDIKKASKSKLNIVTDMIALDLAVEMKEKFDVDYIYFDKHLNKEIITENYKKLEKILGINLLDDLKEQISLYDKLFTECKNLYQNKKLIYGNTPMMALEVVDFLSEIGITPVFVQLRELYEQDIVFKDNLIKKGFNPYVSRIANIAPLRHLYDKIGADIYVGHENPMLLRQKGLMQITFDSHAQKIGFELPISIMKDLIDLINGKIGGFPYASM